MAGVKGKSGGPRKGAGGARPGAGRKPKNKPEQSANHRTKAVEEFLEPQPHGGALKRSTSESVQISERDMLTLLQDIALGNVEASDLQVRAAIAAVQYTHSKKGEGGKKDQRADAASRAAKGKFAAAPPPLRAVK